jgi:uncharacterized membrane protein (DUF4010 family)
MSEEQQILYRLGAALAIGLLVGVERGWHERDAKEGARIAGVRTYGLIGLLGGGMALIAENFGALVLGLAFVALAGVLAAVYVENLRRGRSDVGITSLVAALLTFALGALAAMGEVVIAAACAVLSTLLLGYKPQLHRWVNALEGEELRAGIQLLLISVVLLPILPNRGFGPWAALNPYAIWWMVVLIAGLSFVGYFAVKIGGAARGTVFTGLAGGLASSTAVTLHFSRLAARDAPLTPVLATGVLLACGTMFPRMLLVASLLNRELFQALLVPAAVMAVCVYAPALVFLHRQARMQPYAASPLKNPLELKTALGFGVLLAAVMLFGKALQHFAGDAGVLTLAAASGIADVDAITLSLARMSGEDLGLTTAAFGVVIAGAVNSLVKGAIAGAIGGRDMGLRVALPLAVAAAAGLAAAWLWIG